MYKNHNSLLQTLEVIALVILEFCPGHNNSTIRDIILQPLSNNRKGGHLSFLPILLISEESWGSGDPDQKRHTKLNVLKKSSTFTVCRG